MMTQTRRMVSSLTMGIWKKVFRLILVTKKLWVVCS